MYRVIALIYLILCSCQNKITITYEKTFSLDYKGKLNSIIEFDDNIYVLGDDYEMLKFNKNGELLRRKPGKVNQGGFGPSPKYFFHFNKNIYVVDSNIHNNVYKFDLNLEPLDTIDLSGKIDAVTVYDKNFYIHFSFVVDDIDNFIFEYDKDFNFKRKIPIEADTLYPHRNNFELINLDDGFLAYYKFINKIRLYDSNFYMLKEYKMDFLPDSAKCLNVGKPAYLKPKNANLLSIIPQEILIDDMVYLKEVNLFVFIINRQSKKELIITDRDFKINKQIILPDCDNAFLENSNVYYSYKGKIKRIKLLN